MRLLGGIALSCVWLSGCGDDCPTPVAPAAACVRVASGQPGELLVLVTPECGIVDATVHVEARFGGERYDVPVDADGRAAPFSVLTFGGPEELELSYGGGCATRFCVAVNGPGPARECGSLPTDFRE